MDTRKLSVMDTRNLSVMDNEQDSTSRCFDIASEPLQLSPQNEDIQVVMQWIGDNDTGATVMASSSSSSSFITERKQLLKSENGHKVRTRSSSATTIERRSLKKRMSRNMNDDDDVDEETKSQQFAPHQKESMGFLRRTFSFQIGKTKEPFRLDPETSAMIKLRYKDTSKYVIWPDCALPEEYNQGYLTLNSDRTKRTAIRYNHAGNHQAAVLRLKDGDEATEKDQAIVPFGSPKTFPRTKSQDNQYQKQQQQRPTYTIYPARTLPSTSLATVEEEQQQQQQKQPKRALSLGPESVVTSGTVVDIEDDRTPVPKRVINSVRRSESSDEDEPIVSLTAPRITDESGFGEGEFVGDDDGEEPDLQIWRL